MSNLISYFLNVTKFIDSTINAYSPLLGREQAQRGELPCKVECNADGIVLAVVVIYARQT